MAHLQFFSDEKFKAGSSWTEYERYWRDNGTRLPDEVLRINGGMLPEHCFDNPSDAIFLHDARIRAFNACDTNIDMLLHGDNQGALREIFFRYSGVTKHTPISEQLMSDVPESDLLVHETTVAENGQFNHTMLFANEEILSIQFKTLDVRIVDHPLPT